MEKENYLFIDAECDGLHGSFLTVAMLVTDCHGKEIEHAYYGIRKEKMIIQDSWVQKNVFPILGDYKPLDSETELLEYTWQMWEKWKESCYVVADVPFPVENRLFQKSIQNALAERKMKGPFPMLDLASIIFAKGIDPLKSRYELLGISDNYNQHNALEDVRIAARVFFKLMEGNI